MYKVSILIPIYNVEKYLHQCLDSVVNQTLEDIEIICINDGSTDNSPAIINEFADKDDRIKVINKPNTGYGHSMNQGLKMAQGEYIGIVESDDFADLNMFETLYNKAKKVDAEVIKSNYWWQTGDNSLFNEYLAKETYEKIYSPRKENPHIFACSPNIWSGIYKRKFLIENDINFNETPGASYQDIGFIFKILSCVERLFLFKDAFLHYRRDNPNASVRSKKKAYCTFDELNEIKRFLSNRSELFKPCIYMLSVLKYKEFESNFNRIDDSFKFGFFYRMLAEFEQDKKDGYLDKIYWQEDKWQEVELMLADKEKFFYKQYEQLQKSSLYLRGILTQFQDVQNIYIYGAGKIASWVLFHLIQRQIKINGLLVTDKKDNVDEIMKIPVYELKKANIDKEKDCVLVAMKEENQYDLVHKLKSDGFRNVILITKELRRALS